MLSEVISVLTLHSHYFSSRILQCTHCYGKELLSCFLIATLFLSGTLSQKYFADNYHHIGTVCVQISQQPPLLAGHPDPERIHYLRYFMIITEFLGLGKSSETMESNYSNITAKATANPYPHVPHMLNPSTDGDSTTGLGSLCQSWTILSLKKLFPNVQPHLPLRQLETVSPHDSPFSVGAEPNVHLAAQVKDLCRTRRSPLSLLFSRLSPSRFLSHSLSNVL